MTIVAKRRRSRRRMRTLDGRDELLIDPDK